MKFGTQLGAFGKPDRKEALRMAKSFGCEGLEVDLPVAELRTGKVKHDQVVRMAEELRRDFSEAGMEFISLTPGILLKHSQHPDVIKATCEIAKLLGVKQIRMFFAPHVRWGGPKSKLPDWIADYDGTRNSRDWMKQNTEELTRILTLSEGFDVRYVFELHHGYVINSASGAMRMLERFPASRVGILMDPGNMVFEGNEGWRNSIQIMGEYLGYIHCKNSMYRQENGRWQTGWAGLSDGIANYPEMVTALKDTGFEGYLSIEDLRGALPVEERVGKAIAYLKGLAASKARVMPV